ncbi:tellurium resistance protein terz-like [Gigaspora margarita]|uniref:Tellurium resistance protein terz-like n=1 Tax=Gigaspora margarita TaxID=4874 RepID=A0A8H4AGN7_GIGMA|nr:tellurium resistance protein terz-like [Gigaspora margarita]
MKCVQCQIRKLSKEFPDKSVSSKCEHAMSWCLEDFQDDATNSILENCEIHANSHIQLIIVLYSIIQDQALTNLAFDLNWVFPHSGQDFLDGTCLIYEGASLWKKYDYISMFYPSVKYIEHSGDIIDHQNSEGHHKKTIKLDDLPIEVGQLYLILSSWRSPTIGHFWKPSFKLYNVADPDRQLCNYSIEQAKNSQAVIMCLINRLKNGMCHVIEVGETSSRNAKDYGPIEKNIRRLM